MIIIVNWNMSKVSSQYGKGVELCVSWVQASNGTIPDNAIHAGGNCYVARARHENEFIPGKLVEGYDGVYICYGGGEHFKQFYEVLVKTSVLSQNSIEWKWSDGSKLPNGALVGGTDGGEPLYIAKGHIDGEQVVGKFFPSHGCSYFPYGDSEHRRDEAEILCCVTKHV